MDLIIQNDTNQYMVEGVNFIIEDDSSNEDSKIIEYISSRYSIETPKAVKIFLSKFCRSIMFLSRETFTLNNRPYSNLGFYDKITKTICICTNMTLSGQIMVLHHEIGHFIEHMMHSMYYFTDNNKRVQINSAYKGELDDIYNSERYIYRDNYTNNNKKEFLVQSYAEYIVDTSTLYGATRTRNHIANVINMLDGVERIFETYGINPIIGRLHNNMYLVEKREDDVDIPYITNVETFEEIMFLGAKRIVPIGISWLEKNEKLISVEFDDENEHDKIFILRDDELNYIGKSLVTKYDDEINESPQDFIIILNNEDMFEFISYDLDDEYEYINSFGHSFNKLYMIEDDEYFCWAEKDDCLLLIDNNLDVETIIPGQIDKISSELFTSNATITKDSILFINQYDKIKIYNHKGELIETCDHYNIIDCESCIDDFLIFIADNERYRLFNPRKNEDYELDNEYSDIANIQNILEEGDLLVNSTGFLKCKYKDKYCFASVNHENLTIEMIYDESYLYDDVYLIIDPMFYDIHTIGIDSNKSADCNNQTTQVTIDTICRGDEFDSFESGGLNFDLETVNYERYCEIQDTIINHVYLDDIEF